MKRLFSGVTAAALSALLLSLGGIAVHQWLKWRRG